MTRCGIMFYCVSTIIFILYRIPPGITWAASKSRYTHVNREKRQARALPNIEARVIGGKPATFGQAAYQLRIETDHKLCGGSLMNYKTLPFVLTAAHCLWAGPQPTDFVPTDKIDVIGADLNAVTFSPREQWFKVVYVDIHPDYDPRYTLNDVGIMFLDRYVFESLGLNHVNLPGLDWADPEFVTVSGWGAEYFGGDMHHELQILEVPVVPWQTCKTFLPPHRKARGHSFLGPRELCVGNNDVLNLRGICAGDSGGPAIAFNYTTNDYYLAGITSNVPDRICGDPRSASVFTRVSNYLDWITGYAQGWLDKHGNGNPFQNGSVGGRAGFNS